jgi:hypothetical protein
VLWRKISHGIQTNHCDRAVERLVTIKPAACNADACAYLTDAITAHQHEQPVPARSWPDPGIRPAEWLQ